MLDVRRDLGRIFRGLDGYRIPSAERRRVQLARSTATYGELQPTATRRLLEHLVPDATDVFYDLGSGIGQVALHAALATRVSRSIGIEIVRTRHDLAVLACARAREAGFDRARACEFRCQDFLRCGLSDATLVYTCSTAFPAPLMAALTRRLSRGRSGLRLATLQALPENPWFSAPIILRLDTTWRRRVPVHVYTLGRPG